MQTLYILIEGSDFEDCQCLTGDSAWTREGAEGAALLWMAAHGWTAPVGEFPKWDSGSGDQAYLKVEELEVELPVGEGLQRRADPGTNHPVSWEAFVDDLKVTGWKHFGGRLWTADGWHRLNQLLQAKLRAYQGCERTAIIPRETLPDAALWNNPLGPLHIQTADLLITLSDGPEGRLGFTLSAKPFLGEGPHRPVNTTYILHVLGDVPEKRERP